MRLFFDSNIFLRYFVPEKTGMYEECEALFQGVQSGMHQPYTSAIVVLECSYVLGKLYKFPSHRVVAAIQTILSLRNLVVVDTTDTRKAFTAHQATRMKLSDCLVATQVPEGVTLVTYNRDFAKLPVKAKTPKQTLAL